MLQKHSQNVDIGYLAIPQTAAIALCGRAPSPSPGRVEGVLISRIESKMHHVAVRDDVFLALQPHTVSVAGAGFTVERDVIVISVGLGTDGAFIVTPSTDNTNQLGSIQTSGRFTR